MPMKFPMATLAASVALLLPAAAQSQAVVNGRLLASGCFQCHGTAGLKGGFGTLAGVPQKDNMDKLRDMRTKNARSSIMYPHARGYTDAQLLAITAYFASLPKP